MRRLSLLYLVMCGVLVTPAAAWAQSVAQAAAAAASNASVSQAPAPSQAPAQASAPATDLDTRSLFEPRANQGQVSGRFSSIDGDPARFQRYQDLRDGLLFTDARYARDDPGGAWLFRAAADNVGWRDGRYAAEYQRTGHFVISGMFDQIPQFGNGFVCLDLVDHLVRHRDEGARVVRQRRLGHQDQRLAAGESVHDFSRSLSTRELSEKLFDVLDLEGAGLHRILLDEIFHVASNYRVPRVPTVRGCRARRVRRPKRRALPVAT